MLTNCSLSAIAPERGGMLSGWSVTLNRWVGRGLSFNCQLHKSLHVVLRLQSYEITLNRQPFIPCFLMCRCRSFYASILFFGGKFNNLRRELLNLRRKLKFSDVLAEVFRRSFGSFRALAWCFLSFCLCVIVCPFCGFLPAIVQNLYAGTLKKVDCQLSIVNYFVTLQTLMRIAQTDELKD